ncbi:hypothetical protein HZP66_01910 [Elizabethkingia anophelis]|nr:hypothetical protein [Elizabethkingia anophelis]
MALTPKFNMRSIDKILKGATDDLNNSIIRVLRYVGEKAVNEARTNGNYLDHTANLRNSIGYVIVIDGKVIDQNFTYSSRGAESKDDGVKIGKNLALEIARQQKEIALIVVAGMKYALYVESTGRNVLTSAEQLANIQVPSLLNQLRR